MGKQPSPDIRFGKWLKDARGAKHWSQIDMAKQLKKRGIHIYGSTVAKIEAGDRPVKLAELVAIADLFQVSVDTALCRGARQESDQIHALLVVADSAVKSSAAIVDVASTIRDRLAELADFTDLPDHDTLVAGYERAYGLLVGANNALTGVAQTARESVGEKLKVTR